MQAFSGILLKLSRILEHCTSPAPGLEHAVIILQHHQVRVAAHCNPALAVIHPKASGRVDGTGIDCRVKGDHGLFHQDLKAPVQVQRASRNGVRSLKPCQAVIANLYVMAAQPTAAPLE